MRIEPESLATQSALTLSSTPLTLTELQVLASDLVDYVTRYRPEYSLIAQTQRYIGSRIGEMFQPARWSMVSNNVIHLQPQKGNALRVLSLSEVGLGSVVQYNRLINDMTRLPRGQYANIMAAAMRDFGIYRLGELGFVRPSSHFFRHLKVKELNDGGQNLEYISTWIGERNADNLNYYLDSQYFRLV